MSFFKPRTWGIGKVVTDIENYRDWVRVIKRESKDQNSKFSKWKLQHNYFYTVYFTHDIEETESQLPERVMQLRMLESIAPLHRYLDEELGFAECLTPEFNRFIDEEGNPTLTYLIAYRFSFNQLSLWWLIKFFVKWGVLITGIILAFKYNAFAWLQGLI